MCINIKYSPRDRHDVTSVEPTARPEVPEGLPNSARQVFATLAEQGPLTHKDLVRVTGMPGRTVRYAVGRLREVGVVSSRGNLQDCRQCYFFLDCRTGAEGDACAIVPHRGANIVARSKWPSERL